MQIIKLVDITILVVWLVICLLQKWVGHIMVKWWIGHIGGSTLVIWWSHIDLDIYIRPNCWSYERKKIVFPAHMVVIWEYRGFFSSVMLVWSYMYDHIMATSWPIRRCHIVVVWAIWPKCDKHVGCSVLAMFQSNGFRIWNFGIKIDLNLMEGRRVGWES